MAIKTRETNGTGVTNNNAPLSNSDLDNNFIELVAEDATKLDTSGGTLTGSLTTGSGITLNGAQTGGYPSLTLQSGSSSTSYILMGTSADPDEGSIQYRPADDTMTFVAGTNWGFQVTDEAYVKVYGNSTNGSGAIQLNCGENSHGVKIKGPPHSASANYTLTLPNNDGTNGQALTTDGSGGLSWTTITSGSTLTIKDEGSALTTAATTLNFTGAGVTATGSGAEKTITISGGGGSGGSGVGEGKALVFANLFG